MTGMGMALMGTGVAKGEDRALEAAQRAISSPLLEETSIEGAKGVLLNISGGSDLTLHEVHEAAKVIAEAVDPSANIISGLVIREDLQDEMKITVIATGFASNDAGARLAARPLPRLFEEGSGPVYDEPVETPTANVDEADDVPFYRKVIAQAQNEDPNGYGPNWSNVDDFDIPTVLRKQMD
jgi:cell division protein FtsZ